MVSIKELIFSGGMGGGSGAAFKNRPDNLRSTDSFETLIGLTSMRASLAPGGLQNLFVNDVPIEDESGHSSLEDFTALVFDGDPTSLEPIKLTLGTSAGPTSIGLTLSNPEHSPGEPGPWVNGAITQQGVDFIDLRFMVQQLYRQDKKGIYDLSANIEVQLRPSGVADWINPFTSGSAPQYDPNGIAATTGLRAVMAYLIRAKWDALGQTWSDTGTNVRIFGKTTSPYVKEIRVAVPNTGAYANKTWQIRCRLLERDYYVGGKDNLDEEHRDIVWESAAGVSQTPLGGTEEWRGLSYIQVYGKASDQINGVPEITGIFDIGRYQVPPITVFNPTAQTYTGAAWDGVTTQVAWTQCPAWQIKGLIEDDLSGVSALAPGSTLNKWDTLEASKWYAERVPDGRGGTQPRYTANWIVEQPMQVNELVNYLAGAVGSFAWDEGDGRWRMKVDKPETPQMIFTKENILSEFIYTHTDFDSRFNDFTGVYRDRDNRYQENRCRVFNQPSIDLAGRKHTTVVLIGCDNRQEALRRLKLRELTSLNETRIVTFTTNRQGGLLEQFSVIGVADGDLNSSTAIRSTGRITEVSADRKSVKVRDTLRLEPGVLYQVHCTIPNPAYNPETVTQPTSPHWRKPTITLTRTIINTTAQRGDVYELFFDTALPAILPEFAPVALEAVGLPALPKQYRVLSVTPNDDGESVTISASEIYTPKWVESDNVNEDEILAQVPSKTVAPPTAPANGMFVIKTFKSDFADRRVLSVNWNRPALMFMEGYRVEMRHNGGPWQDLGLTKDNYYELQDPQHGSYTFRIYVRDRKGRESEPLVGSFDVNETALVGPVGYLTREIFGITTEADGTGGDYSNAHGRFVVTAQKGDIEPSEVSFSVISATPWIVIDAAGVFTIGETGSLQATATMRAVWMGYEMVKTIQVLKVRQGEGGTGVGDGDPPPTPTGLALSSTVETGTDGKPWIKLLANWFPSPAPDLAGYTVAIKEGPGGFVEFSTGPLITSFYWQAMEKTSYTVKIRAHDHAGLTSSYSDDVTLLTLSDITPPAPPTWGDVTAAFQTIFLNYRNPPDADLAFVEVWESTNADGSGAFRIAVVPGAPGTEGVFSRAGLTQNTTRYYYLKAVDLAGNASEPTTIEGATTVFIEPLDIAGQLSDAQIEAVAAEKITGELSSDQISSLDAAKLAGQIGSTQIAADAIGIGHFASGITPMEIVDALPTTDNFVGRSAVLKTDGKTYRYTSTGWSAAVAAVDLTGTLVGTQIGANAITTTKIAADAVSANHIQANAITSGKIAADAITVGHIAAGAVTATAIAADQIAAVHIKAAAITTGHIAADTITAYNIAANAITANELAANAVTAAHISAGSVYAGHIVAGQITGDKIAANAVQAGHISANQIVAYHIAAGQISADKLSVGSLSSISANIGTITAGLLQSPSGQTKIDLNNGRIIFNNGTVMKVSGQGFGSANQFVEWFGPSKPDLAQCTEGNAIQYLKTNGDAYFGGSLSAGILTTKASTSSLAANAEAETAQFGSTGRTITVNMSYYYNYAFDQTSYSGTSGGGSGTSSPVTITLYRAINGGAYVPVASINTWSVWDWFDLPATGEFEPGYVHRAEAISGSLTYTDPQTIAQDRRYKAVLTTRTLNFPFTSNGQVSQNISVICVEQ